MNTVPTILRLSCVLGLTLAVTACAIPQRPGESGFLGDYQGLERQPGGEQFAAQRASPAELACYSKVLVEPVAFFGPSFQGAAVSREVSGIATRLDRAIRQSVATQYALISAPAEGTLRIRVVITDLSQGNPAANVAAGAVIGVAVSPAVIRAEVEVVDSLTGRRLAALTWAGTNNGIGENRDFGREIDEFAGLVAELVSSR